ncbi:M14 family metallopeptidase [Aquincola agrisoli]
MDADTVNACFAASYAEARGKFLAAADAAGLDVQSHPHPLVGRDGEALAMDVARSGPADAKALLIVSSACHGIEGYCGSAVQNALLADAGFQRRARDAGVAVLYIHALNPWGFSWGRRTTHENVDLNRNFHDFSRPLPENPHYAELAHWLVPETWPPPPQAQAALLAFAAQQGERALQTAISSGQYTHPEGLFYGGQNPTWSQQTLRHVLQDHAQRCERLGWIDLHTGLGPTGHGERIFACRDDAAALARARAWWGDGVTSIYDGSSSSALLVGLMWTVVDQECAQAEYTGIALEYGTVPLTEMIESLRAAQWLENHPEVGDTPQRREIEQRMRAAFYIETDDWRERVVVQGREAADQAVAGLGGARPAPPRR